VTTAPAIKATDEEVAYAVTNITVFGILAMFLYPYVAEMIFTGNRVLAGLFLGTSIHETAQVAGGAIMYDQYMLARSSANLLSAAGAATPLGSDVALVTKLTGMPSWFSSFLYGLYYARKDSQVAGQILKVTFHFHLGFIFHKSSEPPGL
jgi:uncharacterized membrane protein YadS